MILDRAATDYDDIWRQLDFSVIDTAPATTTARIHHLQQQQHQLHQVQPPCDSERISSARVQNGSDDVKCEVKCEPTDEQRTDLDVISSESDDMLEFLREIKRDWLHFRPKTPPASSAVHQLGEGDDDALYNLTNTTPITVELQTMSATCPSTLLDDSLFTTSAFTLQDLYADTVPDVVSFDDTRQTSPAGGGGELVDPALDRTFGCSRFRVCDSAVQTPSATSVVVVDVPTTPPPPPTKKQSILSSTLTSPKFNSVSVSPSSAAAAAATSTAAAAATVDGRSPKTHLYNHIHNGPLSHTECKLSSILSLLLDAVDLSNLSYYN